MTIKKYAGKTRDEALEAAKADLGDAMVVMNIKTIKGKGIKRFISRSTYEVTAAIEDDSKAPSYQDVLAQDTENRLEPAEKHRFEAVADDDTTSVVTGIERASAGRSRNDEAITSREEDELRDAFRAVSEVMEQANAKENVTPVSTYDRNATLIKYNDPAKSVDYTKGERRKDADIAEAMAQPDLKNTSEVRQTNNFDSHEDDLQSSRIDKSNSIIKAIYRMLLDREVDEKYINEALMDIDLSSSASDNVETALGLVYQKLVLKFGRPAPITVSQKGPQIVFFIGPTGVGKTTTIAKLASEFKITRGKRVAIFTADTYRIAAERQLATYAEIMSTPLEILFENDDINELIAKYHRYDLILVDTTGFSHKSDEQKGNIENLLNSVDEGYNKRVYLVLSATTKYRDLKDIVDVYSSFTDYDLIFTKLDETNAYGNILNIRLYTKRSLSYVTMGQDVPSDIEIIDTQKMTNNLLGGD